MALPDSYTQKPGAIPQYFEAVLRAQAPERFSQKFLERLGFKSTNDRLFISILKDLGFLDTDGVPTERYFRFHDRSQSKRVLAEGIRDAFADLFSVNQQAQEWSTEEVANKLRTLYAGSKTDQVIGRIARTFTALCEVADFSETLPSDTSDKTEDEPTSVHMGNGRQPPGQAQVAVRPRESVALGSLQYHINIVLPESRDQAVYDAIFRSLRDHLGSK